MDKFIIKGTCDRCGELVGTLKPVPGYTGMAYINSKLIDPVMYHVAPTMTKARVKCNDESH